MDVPKTILGRFGLFGQPPAAQCGAPNRKLGWRFTTSDGDILLIRAGDGANRDGVKSSLELGKQLAAFGAPVDRPRVADFHEEGGRLWYLTSYDGEPKRDWANQDFVRAGETLARFHTVGERLADRRLTTRGPLPGFLDKARRRVQSAPTGPTLAVKERVLEQLRVLREATNFVQRYEGIPKIMVHGDFCDRNAVWKDSRSTLIDLELCGMEVALFDLVFFTCEFIRHRHSNWREVFNALMKGYRACGALDPEEAGLTKIVMLHTMICRFYGAPTDPDWAILAEQALSWQSGSTVRHRPFTLSTWHTDPPRGPWAETGPCGDSKMFTKSIEGQRLLNYPS